MVGELQEVKRAKNKYKLEEQNKRREETNYEKK
jgi:hypothetical protein